MIKAKSEAAALEAAEIEALKYADGGDTTYLGFAESYQMYQAPGRSGAEVFSLLRSSNREPASFIARYFDDGSEHRRR